jgi:benzoate/toluate 1,2-dioxygenase reductase component
VLTISVPVRHVTNATPRTRILSLDLSNESFPFAAGQAVMIGLHGSELRKPYSIASAPWEVRKSGVMQVLVQIEDSGGLDPHLELAEPGARIDLAGPFGTFAMPTDDNPCLFVAGGTGIAPLRSIIMERLARPGAPAMALVYSARAPEEFAFRPELEALAIANRITTHFTVTRDETWTGRRGRIDKDLLKDVLPSLSANCFVCGPPQLVNDATELLRALGVDEQRIQIEKY